MESPKERVAVCENTWRGPMSGKDKRERDRAPGEKAQERGAGLAAAPASARLRFLGVEAPRSHARALPHLWRARPSPKRRPEEEAAW